MPVGSTPFRLSRADSEILVHLDPARPISLTALKGHMRLAMSTLSEAIRRLEAHGYVTKNVHDGADRRRVGIALTAKGSAAVRATSVLEDKRLAKVLRRLTRDQRERAIAGLTLIAEACRAENAGRVAS